MTKVKDEKKQLELNLSKKEAELAKTQEQLAAALSRIEISSAAAVGPGVSSRFRPPLFVL